MRTLVMVVVLCLPASLIAASPDDTPGHQFDLGTDVSSYQRFLVYPHLQRGFDLLRRRDRSALAEFERARAVTPRNATVALYLADAYQVFGESAYARRTLEQQLAATADDPRVKKALAALEPPHRPIGVSTSECAPQANGCAPARGSAHADRTNARSSSVSTTRTATERLHVPSSPARRASSAAATASPLDWHRRRFLQALETRQFTEAQLEATTIIGLHRRDAAVIDELSFRLIEAGATREAAAVLIDAFPFSTGSPAERQLLTERLAHIAAPDVFGDDARQVLRRPLDTPLLRSIQGRLWVALNDCDAVRAVLDDLSPEYSVDDMMRLGTCASPSSPHAAQRAYARAHQLWPGGPGSPALAYQAYANGDALTALTAWLSIEPSQLSHAQLTAAARTALAAGDHEQALRWLADYHARSGVRDREYWALLAQARGTPAEGESVEALEQRAAAAPDEVDVLQLARLSPQPDRQVYWLEQAVTRAPQSASVARELAYAYKRAGRSADATTTFERAAAIDPANTAVQLELGYAYWQRDQAQAALVAFEKAMSLDPTNVGTAQQLAYASQRLSNNADARRYAERALDLLATPTSSANAPDTRELEDRRFGLQRMHEDLGRRMTVNLDGWSGTRVGAGSTIADASRRYRSYSQLDVEYRLGREPVRDGSTIAAYARLFGDGGNERQAFPAENPRLGAGLRWKPWRRHVFYLAGEYQTALEGEPRRDVLLRASASLLNGGRHSDDWHPSGGAWWANNLYLDAAHYVQQGISAATADLRSSVHVKVADRQTIEPFAHVQLSGIKRSVTDEDARFGAGARWNLWHGRSRYDADPRKLTLGLEFQQAFKTYLTDRTGVFISLGSRW